MRLMRLVTMVLLRLLRKRFNRRFKMREEVEMAVVVQRRLRLKRR